MTWVAHLLRMPAPPPPPPPADAVELYTSQMVPGARARAYFAVLSVERFVPGCVEGEWEQAHHDVLADLRSRAWMLGANSVLSVEMDADPFARSPTGVQGLRLRIAGVPALLEDLFS